MGVAANRTERPHHLYWDLAETVLAEKIEVPHDARERGAQLVGNDRDELGLQLTVTL